MKIRRREQRGCLNLDRRPRRRGILDRDESDVQSLDTLLLWWRNEKDPRA